MKPIDSLIESKCPLIVEGIEEFREHGYKAEHTIYMCRLQEDNQTYSGYCTIIDQLVCPLNKEEKQRAAQSNYQSLSL